MAEFYELKKKYESIPQEMARQAHWVCFTISKRGNKTYKTPLSPYSGGDSFNGANPLDQRTWGTFDEALECCAQNDLDGIGFELNDSGIFAIDLDNKPDENGDTLSQKEFQDMANDFVGTLNCYAEWSASGNGIHILCYGDVPSDLKADNNPAIAIHSGAKFFAMTGNSIRRAMLHDCVNEVRQLCQKYSRKKKTQEEPTEKPSSDDGILVRMLSSKSGPKVSKLMDGDTSDYEGDAKKAKQALCNFIAYFANGNEGQIRTIFRQSKLLDAEWEANEDSYVRSAIDAFAALAVRPKATHESAPSAQGALMNVDENGDPIFRFSEKSKQRKNYSLDDTGNALRLYDYFGEHFHWNATDKTFMFWTGKTWITDVRGIVRKYANHLIDVMRDEVRQLRQQLSDAQKDSEKERIAALIAEYGKNVKRVSNKSGKDAMINEMQFLGNMAVENTDFNKDIYVLNTDSGIVDLRTGEIKPFDRDAMLSQNTNVKVSYEEPTEWLRFLSSIFEYPDPNDTKEIVEFLRVCFGYTLTGSTKAQCIFLLHGDGSNGKSTLLNVLQNIMGDYFHTIDSSQLMTSKNNQSVAVQNSMAELLGTRFLSTQETDEGARLSEPLIKQISGDEVINAQKKYGKPFFFKPAFKLWMSTNNLPIIRGKDYGIWRRIILFSFKKQFTEETKDVHLPEKLAAEYDRILGWCIKGAVDYLKTETLTIPNCLKRELANYQEDLDTVLQFINAECFTKEGQATLKRSLYDAYTAWARRSNLPALSEPKFKNEMIKKGHKVIVNSKDHGQYYDGIGVVNNGFSEGGKAIVEEDLNPW